jgi:hypothetical protein
MDSKPQVTQQQIVARMTPSQKLAAFHQLRNTAWQLKSAALRHQHPEWSPERLEAEVRKQFLYART